VKAERGDHCGREISPFYSRRPRFIVAGAL
jgi:hypothetical protein